MKRDVWIWTQPEVAGWESRVTLPLPNTTHLPDRQSLQWRNIVSVTKSPHGSEHQHGGQVLLSGISHEFFSSVVWGGGGAETWIEYVRVSVVCFFSLMQAPSLWFVSMRHIFISRSGQRCGGSEVLMCQVHVLTWLKDRSTTVPAHRTWDWGPAVFMSCKFCSRIYKRWHFKSWNNAKHASRTLGGLCFTSS